LARKLAEREGARATIRVRGRPIAATRGFEARMFRVDVETLEAYFAFDPKREADLRRFDRLICTAAPTLKRYFHQGAPAGQPGMRFRMIGYARSSYRATSGEKVEWPVVGVALQKNYISVYFAVTKGGAPVTDPYAGRLGERRMGHNNFSFERFDDLDVAAAAPLLSVAAQIFALDPENVPRTMRASA
jgi:hypothetical protein